LIKPAISTTTTTTTESNLKKTLDKVKFCTLIEFLGHLLNFLLHTFMSAIRTIIATTTNNSSFENTSQLGCALKNDILDQLFAE